MLCKRAERWELVTTTIILGRTPVYFGVVSTAAEVLVEGIESLEFAMTQNAFVGSSVPGPFCRAPLHGIRWAITVAITNKAAGIGDDSPVVIFNHVAVEFLASDTGGTLPRLPMQYKGCNGYEHSAALFPGARNSSALMHRGFEMVPQIGLALKHFLALNTVKMLLAIVLVQSLVGVENGVARWTVPMIVLVVRTQLRVSIKVLVAALTVIVNRTLHIVLREPPCSAKVFMAGPADVVIARVVFVLPKGTVTAKIAIAAFAVCHILAP